MGTLKARVAWTYTQNITAPEDGFIVERSIQQNGIPLGFAEVGRVGAGVLTFDDAGVANGTGYYYRVCAYTGAPVGAPTSKSPYVQATYTLIATPAPNAPGSVTVQGVIA